MTESQETFKLVPIGHVRRQEGCIELAILEPFRPGLRQLDHFSHVIVLWWADKHGNDRSRGTLQCEPPYAAGKITGVFACRAEYRPNPVAMTTCKVLGVDEASGVVRVADIDAFDGTPVLDLKAYFPVCDRVQDARIPDWLSDWPEWMPEEGLGQ